MMQKAAWAAGMLRGDFVPLLKPDWQEQEWDLVRQWQKGKPLADKGDELEAAIRAESPPGTVVRAANLGRTAIYLALEAMALPEGTEVILPAYSCLGLVQPIVQAGLTPVFADVDEHFNLSLDSVQAAWSPKAGAVFSPHLGGCYSRRFEELHAFCRQKNAWLLSDAAQAEGLWVDGRTAASLGDIGVVSQHGGKAMISCGGAWVQSNHPELAPKLQALPLKEEPENGLRERLGHFLTTVGQDEKAQARRVLAEAIQQKRSRPGTRSTLPLSFTPAAISPLEAALALQLHRRLAPALASRRDNALRLYGLLRQMGLPSLKCLPVDHSIFSLATVWFEGETAQADYARLAHALWKGRIELFPGYTPLHLRPPLDAIRRAGLSRTDALWQRTFAMPNRPSLTSRDWTRIEAALSPSP